MNTSFSVTNENKFDRRFGGTNKGVADPYISGYHFISFKVLPTDLKSVITIAEGNSDIQSKTEIENILAASCLSVTPPGGTLNKAEFTGLGGTKWSVPTNMDYGNTLTIKFLEYSSLPILNIFHGWFRLMRDPRTGVSSLTGTNYTKSSYAGTMLYWTTKPDGLTVEYYAAYSGMFPTKDPQDSYTGDITAYDKLEVDIEFNVDWIWHENWVRTACIAEAEEYHSKGSAAHGHLNATAQHRPQL